MKLKTIAITGALTLTIAGSVGTIGIDKITYNAVKIYNCTNAEVKYDTPDEYWCGTKDEERTDKERLKARVIANQMHFEDGKNDFSLGKLMALNDELYRNELAQIFIGKYNPVTNEFIGDELDSDLFIQSALILEIAFQKTDGKLTDGETLTEKIYNSLRL